MKAKLFIGLLALVLFTTCQYSQHHTLIKNELKLLAEDFTFTEGPATDDKGNVYFTDIPNNKIYIWTLKNNLELYRENSGGANGLFFNKAGNLIICEGKNRQVTSISPKSEIKVLTNKYLNKKYNRPNDLWIDPKGGIYFSDPAYGMDTSQLEMENEGVYYISPDYKSVIQVCSDLIRPNGIIGTRNGEKIYITDHHDNKTWVYKTESDGSLSDKNLFVNIGCDGLTIDTNQYVYLTNMENKSIDVYTPDAILIVSIPVPEKPSNICFGGKNHSTLFITARTSIYSIELNAKGIIHN